MGRSYRDMTAQERDRLDDAYGRVQGGHDPLPGDGELFREDQEAKRDEDPLERVDRWLSGY